MLECKKCRFQQFFQIQGKITPDVLVDLFHNRTHPRPYGYIYIVAKFGTDWSIFADARVQIKSNMANFLIQGQITRTVLVRLHP